jgi:hypothetical protein
VFAFGEFWVEPANQARLVALERTEGPKSLALQGLESINFHRGLDGNRTVNYAEFSDPDALERLTHTPGFASDTAYWQGLARNEFHLYDVTRVLEQQSQ